MKPDVQDMTPAQLDLAVAKIEGIEYVMRGEQPAQRFPFDPERHAHEHISNAEEFCCYVHYKPSTEWGVAGPLIEKYRIDLMAERNHWVGSRFNDLNSDKMLVWEAGPTALMAAMRALVQSKRNEEVRRA